MTEITAVPELPIEEESGETGLPPEDAARAEFERQVEALMRMIGDDPDVRDRIICETYVNIANIETAIRGTFQMLQQEGMAGMFKQMFSRKKGKDNGGSGTEHAD